MSYLTLNDIMTLKSGLEVTQDHSKLYHSKAWVRFPIRLPYSSASEATALWRYRSFIIIIIITNSTMALSGIICKIKRNTDGEKNYNRLDRIPASDRQTDGRTKRQTDRHLATA